MVLREVWLTTVDTTDSFAAALLKAVNLGDDADSVGAVAGQLAGARYGLSAIPTNWLDALILRETIKNTGQTLFNASLEWESNLSLALGDDAVVR